MLTKIDLHSHTRGSDGTGTPAAIAFAARKAGLHGLCLTDHHTNETDEVHLVADALRAAGVLPIIGVEYSTQQGHLLIYGLTVPKMAWGMYPDMQTVIDDATARGGCCIVPHPYKGYQRSLGSAVESIRNVVAIETINGQVEDRTPHINHQARDSALRMGMPSTGASDAHFPEMIGTAYTTFHGEVPDERTFLEALRSGKFVACVDSAQLASRRASREVLWTTQRLQARAYTVPPPPVWLDRDLEDASQVFDAYDDEEIV